MRCAAEPQAADITPLSEREKWGSATNGLVKKVQKQWKIKYPDGPVPHRREAQRQKLTKSRYSSSTTMANALDDLIKNQEWPHLEVNEMVINRRGIPIGRGVFTTKKILAGRYVCNRIFDIHDMKLIKICKRCDTIVSIVCV